MQHLPFIFLPIVRRKQLQRFAAPAHDTVHYIHHDIFIFNAIAQTKHRSKFIKTRQNHFWFIAFRRKCKSELA